MATLNGKTYLTKAQFFSYGTRGWAKDACWIQFVENADCSGAGVKGFRRFGLFDFYEIVLVGDAANPRWNPSHTGNADNQILQSNFHGPSRLRTHLGVLGSQPKVEISSTFSKIPEIIWQTSKSASVPAKGLSLSNSWYVFLAHVCWPF